MKKKRVKENTPSPLYHGLPEANAFDLGDPERAAAIFAGTDPGLVYGRLGHENEMILGSLLAELEGAEAGLPTGTGQSAAATLAFYLLTDKDESNPVGKKIPAHAVVSSMIYGGIDHLFRKRVQSLGIPVTFIKDPHDLKEWKDAICPDTKLFWVETPTNPTVQVIDIQKLNEMVALPAEIPIVADNTLAPTLDFPIQKGATFIARSDTKFLGNGYLFGGCILGPKADIDAIRHGWNRELGPYMSSRTAADLIKNLGALRCRMLAHCDNAIRVVNFLSHHPKVKRVFYPTIGKRVVVRKNNLLMPNGFGSLLSFEVVGGRNAAWNVIRACKLIKHAANFGGDETLIIDPDSTTHAQVPSEARDWIGIVAGLLRLSVGLESWEAVVHDLDQALGKI